MRTLIRLALALIVLGALGAGGFYFWIEKSATTPRDPEGAQKPGELRVPKGATVNQVGVMLQEAGYIDNALVWKLYARIHGAPALKAGRHPIHPGMAIPELMRVLADTPLSDDVPLTMVEGWRIRDADAWMASQKLITAGSYIAAAGAPSRFKIPFPFNGTSLEGYLYPETYMVPPGPVDVDKLVQRQIDVLAAKFFVPYREEIEKSGHTLHELVIMASMLEREEPLPEQRPAVAAILYKRISMGYALGVDATSRYNLVDWNDRKPFLAALRDPDEPYNTRLRVGLPPGPIGAPSIESLLAALRPVKSTPYLYYLHDAERKIHFARTAEEHEANRKRYNVY